jgi:hypothetical protein
MGYVASAESLNGPVQYDSLVSGLHFLSPF